VFLVAECISGEGNSVGRVRLSVCLLPPLIVNELAFDLRILHRVCNDSSPGIKSHNGSSIMDSKDGSGFDPQICFFYTVRQKKRNQFSFVCFFFNT